MTRLAGGYRRRLVLWGAVALAMLALVPASASADGAKLYTVQFSTAASGSTTQFTAVIHNAAATQSLGSANLTPPPGYTLAPSGGTVSGGTATAYVNTSGGIAQARNLGIKPGASASVTLEGDGCGTGAWTTAAKQSNDFLGTNNDFTLAQTGNQLGTTSYTGCRLSFSGQPANTARTQAITTNAYDPTGPPVTVTVANGGAGVPVTLRTAAGAALGGTTTQTTNRAGVASFPGIHIDTDGIYNLVAGSGGQTATSQQFGIADPQGSSSCTSVQDGGSGTCQQSATVTESGAGGTLFTNTITAAANQTSPSQSSGTLLAGWVTDGSHKPDCSSQGYTDANAPAGVPGHFFGPQWHKTITLQYAPAAIGPLVSGDVCFAGTAFYVGKGSTTQQTFDGQTYYVNLLLDCANTVALAVPPPCVAGRTDRSLWATQGLTITIDVPVLYTGDPYTH